MKKEMIEDVVLVLGLIGVQFMFAGSNIFMSYFMSFGLAPLTLVIYSSFAAFIILAPIAYHFERSKWPNRISLKLAIRFFLIAFGGYSNIVSGAIFEGDQSYLPAMATAVPNLVPGLIFVIACIVRLEKIQFSCRYSRVKILGTMLCVAGALVMSVMHSATSSSSETETQFRDNSPDDMIFDRQKVIGCLYLLVAVFVLSSNLVLQAVTLGEFPAPMPLCAVTSLIGVFITAAVQLIQDHKVDLGWPIVSARDLISLSLMGGMMTGVCISFNGWAMKKKGPVLVSMFNPVGTVISVVLSVITLGESISFGSLAGMCLMFTGLYLFLWAKGKEGFQDGIELGSEPDLLHNPKD